MGHRHDTSRDTSQAAAEAIEPAIPRLHAELLAYLHVCRGYGATDEEMQTALNMNPSTQRPRRGELVFRNRVADSGRTRLTRAQRRAIVWVLPEYLPHARKMDQ